MKRKEESPAENGQPNGKRPAWPLLAGLALVALLAGVAAVSCSSPAQEQQRAEEPVGDELKTEESQARADPEHPSLGEKNAPVLMIEYADYQ